MDYLPTLGEKWPHSEGNVGKYSIHGSYAVQPPGPNVNNQGPFSSLLMNDVLT